MRTIAISIDEGAFAALERLRTGGQGARPSRRRPLSRSEIIRNAIHDYLARRTKQEREARDRRILAAHRDTLARQAEALVAEQAEP